MIFAGAYKKICTFNCIFLEKTVFPEYIIIPVNSILAELNF